MRRLLLLLALLLAAPGAAAAATVEAPATLAAGDFWEYTGSMRGGAGVMGIALRVEVVGFEPLELPNGSVVPHTLHLRSTTLSNALSGNATTVVDAWYRPEDHGILQSVANITREPGRGENQTTTTEYELPCVERAHPFTLGSTWLVDCFGVVRLEGSRLTDNYDRIEDARVTAESKVEIPAGTYDTLVISYTPTGGPGYTNLFWYAPRVCNHVKIETTTDSGIRTEMALRAWRCGDDGSIRPAPGLAPVLVALVAVGVALAARPKGS